MSTAFKPTSSIRLGGQTVDVDGAAPPTAGQGILEGRRSELEEPLEECRSGHARGPAAEGLVEVESGSDVLVTYFAGTNQQIVVTTTGMAHHRGRGWHRRGNVGMTTTTATTVRTGTLVIDIYDVAQDLLVGRGLASDTISNDSSRNADLIRKGVSRVFQGFPP